jgi:hypothetical protein
VMSLNMPVRNRCAISSAFLCFSYSLVISLALPTPGLLNTSTVAPFFWTKSGLFIDQCAGTGFLRRSRKTWSRILVESEVIVQGEFYDCCFESTRRICPTPIPLNISPLNNWHLAEKC